MTTVTFERPAPTLLRTVAGKPVYLDWALVPEAVMSAIMIGGAKIILTNAFNGGGKDVSETARLAQMLKRIDAWQRGEYVQVERGENAYTAMKEAFVDERRAATGASAKDVEASIRVLVTATFGKDEKATFARFLDAIATLKAKEPGALPMAEIRTKLEVKYAKLADDARKARDAVSAKLDVSDITF